MEPFIHQVLISPFSYNEIQHICNIFVCSIAVFVLSSNQPSKYTWLCEYQVLTYAQQSKEQASIEHDRLAKRIQEFRTQAEMKEAVPSNVGHVNVNGVGMSSDKDIDAIMQSTTKGTVSRFSSMHFISSASSASLHLLGCILAGILICAISCFDSLKDTNFTLL